MTEQYGRPFLFSLDETKPLKEQILMDIGDEDTDLVTAWHLTAEREFRSRMPEPYTVEGEMVLALRVFQGVFNSIHHLPHFMSLILRLTIISRP